MTDLTIKTELHPRLIVKNVDEALDFYRAVFDAEPLGRFANGAGIVVHAAMRIGDALVSIAEEVAEWQLLGPGSIGGSPVLLYLTLPDPDRAAERAVSRGSTVVIPIRVRPYGKREGRVRDPFGHLWVLSCPTEDLSDEEIQNRLQKI